LITNRYLVRCGIVLFWIGLILCGLYLPKWKMIHIDTKSISIFTWGDILDPASIRTFEQETGIKVHLNFYSSNEELLVKLKATGGIGYDLIVPSDYAVKQLIAEELLKELDKSQLNFLPSLNPVLLRHPFDPTNRFSIPFEWEVFTIGYDRAYFENKALSPSWKLLFDKPPYKIAMINDPIEAVQFAAFYLFGNVSTLTQPQIESVKKLLIQQKEWVEAYAESRGDYFLATRNCPVVIASSSYLSRTMKSFPFVGSLLPKEGSFITIENFAIPKTSEKSELVYKFLNYLYKPETVAAHYNTFGFFPATLNSLPLLHVDEATRSLILTSKSQFEKLHFIQALLPPQQLRDLWVTVKVASEE
jgi:spermidine/putrescine transport system substrate-binding protein